MSSSPAPDPRFSVIVPVKGLGAAKSRTQLPSPKREELALTLMTRTVAAALSVDPVARVVVVAGDDTVASAALAAGAQVLIEPDGAGLNGAIRAGRELCLHDHPDDDIVVAVGDLAGLRSADLAIDLDAFARTRAPLAVPDHQGSGTAVPVHASDTVRPILFGADSAART